MGVGASNVLDRMAASLGDLVAVEPVFQAVSDVPNGGVLAALDQAHIDAIIYLGWTNPPRKLGDHDRQ
jgi:hypothetical protein